jgi:hypothetical protein
MCMYRQPHFLGSCSSCAFRDDLCTTGCFRSEFKRKVRLQTGLYETLSILPELLGSNIRCRSTFVRLNIDWCASPVLCNPDCTLMIQTSPVWREAAFGLQLCFYVPPHLTSSHPPCRLRVLPMCSGAHRADGRLAALQIFFVGPERLWTQTN